MRKSSRLIRVLNWIKVFLFGETSGPQVGDLYVENYAGGGELTYSYDGTAWVKDGDGPSKEDFLAATKKIKEDYLTDCAAQFAIPARIIEEKDISSWDENLEPFEKNKIYISAPTIGTGFKTCYPVYRA